MTENPVKQAFYRFRQRYQTLLREEIAHTVAIAGDVRRRITPSDRCSSGIRSSENLGSKERAQPRAAVLQRAAIFRVTSRLILRIT